MKGKPLPFTKNQIKEIIKKYPTPFHIYDEKSIRENARAFRKSFSWNEGFKEYYAIKAVPNPYLMKILHKEGYGADCSSLAELIMAQKTGRGYYQADCLISPDLAGVSYLRLDFDKLVALGEKAAEERLPAIQTALEATGTSVPTTQ